MVSEVTDLKERAPLAAAWSPWCVPNRNWTVRVRGDALVHEMYGGSEKSVHQRKYSFAAEYNMYGVW